MPELPLVEKARKEAVRRLKGRRMVTVRAVRDPIMMPGLAPAQFVKALRGAGLSGRAGAANISGSNSTARRGWSCTSA